MGNKMTSVLQLDKTLVSNVVATKRLMQENKEIKQMNIKRLQKIEDKELDLDEKIRCLD